MSDLHVVEAQLAPEPPWADVNEARRLLGGRSRTFVYQLIADGTLKSIRLRGRRLIWTASIRDAKAD